MYWSHGKKKFVTYICYLLQRTTDFSASRALWFCKSKIKSEIESASFGFSNYFTRFMHVCVYLNNLFAGRLFKGQCGAMFQQGICVKTKNPAGTQERESSWVSKTSKENQRQVGRQ